ncbi:hypothetical protein [Streptomyces sp. NPDC052721]|uniref:WXG100 family type VII secretion target n=1 Tax=Streptomyces sp. NPDC052721 TaxID=3154955 RepID=UPI0034339481
MPDLNGDGIHLQYREVGAVVDELWRATQRIDHLLDGMEQQLIPLVSSWSGWSMQGFQTERSKWEAICAQMARDLGQNATLLDDISTTYNRTDTHLGDQWSGVWGGAS